MHYLSVLVYPHWYPIAISMTSSNCNPNQEDMTSIRLCESLMLFNKKEICDYTNGAVLVCKWERCCVLSNLKKASWQKSLFCYVRLNILILVRQMFIFCVCICVCPHSIEALEDGSGDESFAGHRYASPASGTQSTLFNHTRRSNWILFSFLILNFLHGSFIS